APPRGSPVSEVILPLMTASCAASGAAVNVSVTSAAATVVASSVPNLRTRISCLSCEEGTRIGRHFLQGHSNVTNPLGPRPTAERDGLQTSQDQMARLAPRLILPSIRCRARGVSSNMIAANRILAPALLAALASLIAPASGVSQATVRGRVMDSEMGTPLAGATVQVGKSGPAVKTDSGGVFVAQNVTPGVIEIEIRQIGFEPGTFDIRIPESGVVQGVFPLDFNGFMLPAVVVEARAVALMPRYTDFERRRQRKMGAYLRWDEIKKQGAGSIGDALRTV